MKKFAIILLSAVLAPLLSHGLSSSQQPSVVQKTYVPDSIQCQKESFSIPLRTERPAPRNLLATLNQLWNDPRPVTTLIGNAVNQEQEQDDDNIIPYCLWSDEFQVADQHKFRILLYPRGRYASSPEDNNNALVIAGPASAYLRYVPNEYGDEVDVALQLQLIDTRKPGRALPITTSGGLPKSNTTWSAAMTFVSEREGLESVGRASDWGASTWDARTVCNALGYLEARVNVTIFESRRGESSFIFPPKGAIRAAWKAATNAGNGGGDGSRASSNNRGERSFRAGEVIVPMPLNDSNGDQRQQSAALQAAFVYPGTDYRIMTMTSQDGRTIFSTNDVPPHERQHVKLALRPCGWKLQQQLWQSRGMKVDWPVEVSAGLLSSTALTRFNLAATFPRIVATVQRDKWTVLLGVALALSPIAGTLVARNFVSLYAIPSASMDPTLVKGDVLLVEKFPGVVDRTNKGDIVLFQPPSALTEMMGRSVISGNSLFVKRVVGMPGDVNIVLDPKSQEVAVGGLPAVGPNRNLCDDEPLRLIDRLLENGKGKIVDQLGDDEVYVLGDCKDVSVDSRVFGPLPKQNIKGKPVGRIWPPSRVTFGRL